MHHINRQFLIANSLDEGDVNGDGRLDVFGALIHDDGNLPKEKVSVFWLENPAKSSR